MKQDHFFYPRYPGHPVVNFFSRMNHREVKHKFSSVGGRDVIYSPAMSVGRSIWDNLFRVVLVLLVVASVLGILLWYQPVIEQNQRMREEKFALDQKIETETEAARTLDASLRALQNPATVERLARERLSYAKPGEDVIHFDPPGSTP